MDGAGRLDRSLRSLRPQADLKAAAIGAVVLLREWLGSRPAPANKSTSASRRAAAKSKRVPAKQRLERAEELPRLITLVERYIPRRAGVAATVLLLLGSAGFGVVKGGHL